ncbi:MULTISPECIES: UDP-glucose 4-epimerase GalE [Gordonia]|uniref:UDP-glucose 4-epimerase n=2 Tax=Gordonia TaxID=2053 RepID=L7LN54_9ACTN|nr:MULTISPECIES: UDP-glucose 4-epimerase GalE [Gordonia]AUH67811.1 UDP-glucose 4-epimerase GalE [Gordonia sp. YC-JH1]MBY4570828.1 UDP-glucose 4-epimerase GalE [Gordonia sihwensis]GAC62560.1 UDP-glucose 4-epimerase [Gordonia sihwensis NBRC 108236]
MRVLVTGGAGYIGSHTVLQLLAAGHDVLIADDFSNAKPAVIDRLEELSGQSIKVHRVDLTDEAATAAIFAAEDIDAVIHFAGFKAVGESVSEPLKYYRNNLDTAFSVLRAMDARGVRKFVFSSSATVYGENPVLQRTEDMPTSANNPYGWTKVMIEQVLRDLAVADDSWRIALLRYFNPVGAHASGRIGEDPNGLPNNLMPFVAQVAVGRREKLSVFGDDYDTVDGTGVRDYIHVEDLAAGHIAALDRLGETADALSVWNLGSGEPVSVLQLVAAFERASGRTIPYEVVARRPGDLAANWADPSKANRELGWHAGRGIDDMCADVWRWQSQNPNGYPDA